jgi:hypothetical protein
MELTKSTKPSSTQSRLADRTDGALPQTPPLAAAEARGNRCMRLLTE